MKIIEHPAITRIEKTGYGYPEPEIWGVCSGCGEPIYLGDTFYNIAGGMFCTECIAESRQYAD